MKPRNEISSRPRSNYANPCLKFLEKNIAEYFHFGWTISYLAHASKLRTTCSTLKSNISLRGDDAIVSPCLKFLEKHCRTLPFWVNYFLYLPEFGLSLFSKNKVCPKFGVRPQLPETLSQKRTGLPLQPPTRTRSARVRRFSFFAFTSSPYDRKNL